MTKRERFKIKCSQCNKTFEVQKYLINVRKFCSRECNSKSRIGSIPYNKGKKSPEISKGKLGKKRPDMVGNSFAKGKPGWCKDKKGIHQSPESEFKKGMIPWNKGLKGFRAGEKNHLWKGGITRLVEQIRKSLEYKQWRLSVYERDGFICQMPNCDKTERVPNAHHIITFAEIIGNNNIRSLDNALICKELWDINNGITLCKRCHTRIGHKESQYEKLFQEIVKLK